MAGDPNVLALDVGTSSVRAMLFDADARPLPEAFAKIPYRPTAHPGGGATFDADVLFEKTCDAIDLVAARAPDAFERVAAVGISTFWHSVVGVDEHGRARTPLLLWVDMRSAEDAARLRGALGFEAVRQRTGCPLHAAYVPAKLAWLKRVDPEAFSASRHFLSFGELLSLRLFGEPVVSPSMASASGLLDLRAGVWDVSLLDALGIRPDRLGILVDSDFRQRKPLPDARARWKPLADVPWAPAVGDGATGNFGTAGVGSKRENRVVAMVGTSSSARATLERKPPDTLPPGLWTYRLAPARTLMGGSFGSGGNLVQWAMDTFKLANLDDAEAEIAWSLQKDRVGSIACLPWLAGERSPGWNDAARGAFSNVSFDTRPADFLQAALESVAFAIADVVESMTPAIGSEPEVIASGFALVKSPVWIQILADVLGRPIVRSPWKEASARGAAMLALVAGGIAKDLTAISSQMEMGEPVAPSRARHELYKEARARGRALYSALMPPR
ncbi:MAG TPA: gluconokinase [bacterium]|nr:gluconokinase [bacterium]